MAMVDLKHLYRVTAKGRTYFYAWRGGPRIRAQPGTPAFAAEYAAHHEARKTSDRDHLAGLIADWQRSGVWTKTPEAGGLALSTRKAWKAPLADIQLRFGKLRVTAFDQPAARPHIKTWLKDYAERPRARDMRKQVLSALLSWAVEEDRLKANPCFGIANLYESDRADIIWTEDDIVRLAATASPEVMFALGLACLTGLRQSDLLRLTWSEVGDLAIETRAHKSRKRGRGLKTAVIPLYQELRDLLAVIPKRALTVLTNSDGEPWRGFNSSWTAAAKGAGLDKLHFHDARGTFATWTYELDVFSAKELAEMLGWSLDKVERILTRYVRRDALLRDRIRRIDDARKAREVRQ